jgi:hypothetical protein
MPFIYFKKRNLNSIIIFKFSVDITETTREGDNHKATTFVQENDISTKIALQAGSLWELMGEG